MSTTLPETNETVNKNAPSTPVSNADQQQRHDEAVCIEKAFREARRAYRKQGRSAMPDSIANVVLEKLRDTSCERLLTDSSFHILSLASMVEAPLTEIAKIRPSFETKDVIGDVIFSSKKRKPIYVVWSKDGKVLGLYDVYPIDSDDETKGWYVPPTDRHDNVEKKVVTLPIKPVPYGSTAQLVAEIKHFIRKYYAAQESWIEIMAYYAMMTWVADSKEFSAVPYLRWLGEPETGKTRGLEVVARLSYRATSIGGATTSPVMFRIIDEWRGTLVMDEADFRAGTELVDNITKILNMGYLRHATVPRLEPSGKGIFDVHSFEIFGPKILSTRLPFEDTATETRCITFPTKESPVPMEIPLHLQEQFYNEAQALQNKLLQWRINNRQKIRVNDQEIRKEHGTRIAQIGAALLAVVDDVEAQQRIISFLRIEGKREKSNRKPAVVLEALRRILAAFEKYDEEQADPTDTKKGYPGTDECKLRHDRVVLVKHVTCWANGAAADLALGSANTDRPYISIKETGSVLRSLGFNPKITNQGREVTIDDEKLEQKGKEYGV